MSGPYNYRWQQARRRFLQAHPCCRMCADRGIVAAADTVDHVVPHKGDPVLFWDQGGNWQSVCKPCHDSRKAMLERGDKVEPHASWSHPGGEGSETC